MISKSRSYLGLVVRDVKIDRSGTVPYPEQKCLNYSKSLAASQHTSSMMCYFQTSDTFRCTQQVTAQAERLTPIPCPHSPLTVVTLVESLTYPVKLPNRGIMNGSRLNRRSVVQSPQPQIVSVVTPHGMFSFEK